MDGISNEPGPQPSHIKGQKLEPPAFPFCCFFFTKRKKKRRKTESESSKCAAWKQWALYFQAEALSEPFACNRVCLRDRQIEERGKTRRRQKNGPSFHRRWGTAALHNSQPFFPQVLSLVWLGLLTSLTSCPQKAIWAAFVELFFFFFLVSNTRKLKRERATGMRLHIFITKTTYELAAVRAYTVAWLRAVFIS